MPSRIALQAFVPPLPPPIIPTAAPPEPSPVLQPEVVAAPPGTLTPFAPSAFPVEAASAPTASAFPDPGVTTPCVHRSASRTPSVRCIHLHQPNTLLAWCSAVLGTAELQSRALQCHPIRGKKDPEIMLS